MSVKLVVARFVVSDSKAAMAPCGRQMALLFTVCLNGVLRCVNVVRCYGDHRKPNDFVGTLCNAIDSATIACP